MCVCVCVHVYIFIFMFKESLESCIDVLFYYGYLVAV